MGSAKRREIDSFLRKTVHSPKGQQAEVGEGCDDDGPGPVEPDGGADHSDHDDAQRERDEAHAARHQVRVVGEGLKGRK